MRKGLAVGSFLSRSAAFELAAQRFNAVRIEDPKFPPLAYGGKTPSMELVANPMALNAQHVGSFLHRQPFALMFGFEVVEGGLQEHQIAANCVVRLEMPFGVDMVAKHLRVDA